MTFFEQPAEMERLTKAEKVAKMKQAELSALVAEMDESSSRSSSVTARWNSRYKVMPRTLNSEDVIAELNSLTKNGFNPFNLTFKKHIESTEYNKFVFDISGRGDFSAVYNLIWSLENSREMYRVQDLKLNHFDLITQDPKTLRQKMEVVVNFTFELEAFYGGVAGLSATDSIEGAPTNAYFTAVDPTSNLPAVPESVLPIRHARMNPFFPLILANNPPNTHNLVDVTEAKLVMIAGTEAILEWNGSTHTVGIGDSVYLGQVISVDPRAGTLQVRLNKGGIVDDVELRIATEALYRQASGTVALTPNQQ